MTRDEAVEQLRTLGTAAVWNLAVPAVIRPHADGWLIFLRGGHAWYGTAEAAADALLAARSEAAYPPDSADQAPTDKRAVPGPVGTGGHLIPGSHLPGQAPRGSPPALAPGGAACRAPRASCRPPCHMHCPVTRDSLR